MHLLGLKVVIPRKHYNYKPHSPSHVAENILNREYQKDYQPMEVLLTDVTEFKYGTQAKVYLSVILDYGEKKIVTFKLSKHNNNELVRESVSQIEDRIKPTKTLIHSNRGFQYPSHSFKHFADEHQVIQSMSRAGKCIDNGPMEGFFWTLKDERYRLNDYETFEQLESDIKDYIDFYNSKRVTLIMG